MPTKIDWCDETWSPITGCRHTCGYCYARRLAKRLKAMGQEKYRHEFEPTFHPQELDRPGRWKIHRRVFVCSMADMLGSWVPEEWIHRVLESVLTHSQHTYLFLTKNPLRYQDFAWPKNAWIGATVTGQDSCNRLLPLVARASAPVRFLSVEPMLGSVNLPDDPGINWIIIGQQTGPGRLQAMPQWVEGLTRQAHNLGIPVFHKDNLGALATDKDFPA